MDESTLKAVVANEIRRAIGYMGGTIAGEREKALNYYYGRPFGNEIEGRSQVVSTDVADVIESVMPSIIKIFTAGDDVVKFEPQGPEDEETAQQATDYCNWIFNRDNDGFLILHDWIKDALMQKLGAVKAWWDESEDVTEETYQGLTDMELQQLLQDPEVEPIEHSQYPDPFAPPPAEAPVDPQAPGAPPAPPAPPSMLHDVKLRRTAKLGAVKVVAIPPEEFIVSPGARDRTDARLMGHRKRTTRTKLIEEGYDSKIVMDIPVTDDADLSGESISRRKDEDTADGADNDTLDKTSEWIWVNECYIRVDYDGDGKAELRKITVAGPGDTSTILDNEPVEEAPFYFLCPIRTPHKLIGRSLADLVMDIQLIKSTLQRQLLDNMYLVNAPQTVIIEGQVNLDDLLTRRPGGVVRAKSQGAVEPLVTQPMLAPALQAIEYVDSVRETRTGVTRYNQGLEADSLNKTATGVNRIFTAAQERIEMIARVFAETGVKDLFRGILRLVAKHQQKSRIVRLRNEWTPMDPREWNTGMDMTVSVGLGTGNKDQMLAHIMAIMQLQEKIVQSGGLNTMVSPVNIYNAASDIVKNSGLKSEDRYFTDPSKAPPQQPKPDPEMQKVQAQIQGDQMKAQNDLQLQQAKMQADMQLKREQMMLDFQLKQEELRIKAQQASQAPLPEAPRETDQGATLTASALQAVAAALEKVNAPRRLVRDPATGAAMGVELA